MKIRGNLSMIVKFKRNVINDIELFNFLNLIYFLFFIKKGK